MTNYDDFLGDYLKAENIKEEKEYEIKEFKIEMIGEQKEKKIVLYFDGLDKGLTLNKTNGDSLHEITGSKEVEDWVGKRIILFVDPSVMYMGKKVGGIRIKSPVDKVSH